MSVENTVTIEPQKSKDLSLIKVILLVFVPTTILTAAYLVVGFAQKAIPSLFLFYALALLILFPIELGVILRASKKEFGRYSFQSALVGQRKADWKRTLIIGLLLFSLAGILSITLAPLERSLTAPLSNKLNAVISSYFDWTNLANFKQYPKSILLLTSITYLILNVFVGPIVEELYFRGYLTSKMSRFGRVAPVIITVLFSLYHFWLPFQNLFRICVFLPAAYLAWKEKNIYIAIVFHCLCNLFSSISLLVALYSA